MIRLDKIAARVSGKVRLVTDPETGETEDFVYQRVGKQYGNIEQGESYSLQLRRHVVPTDRKTQEQRNQRGKLARATAAWKALSEAERAPWRKKAKSHRMTGFNLYVQWHMRQAWRTGAARATTNGGVRVATFEATRAAGGDSRATSSGDQRVVQIDAIRTTT